MDQIIISQSIYDGKTLGIQNQDAEILRKSKLIYTYHDGGQKPSATYGGRKYFGGYSDHLPVYIVLKQFLSILTSHNSCGNPEWDKKETKHLLEEIQVYSNLLYAEEKQSVLLVLQGMDASGKDGLTRRLFEGVSSAWVNVHPFKKPSDEEAAHDYLWRIHKCAPKKV